MLKQEDINNWFLNVMNKSIDHTIIQFWEQNYWDDWSSW